MGTVVAFDSKEFNIKGVFKDFFCPIGIGLTVRDVDDGGAGCAKLCKSICP